MDTLLLDRRAWDLALDSGGNMAKASDPYSIAQDVASALRLFAGDLWYDQTKGVPYFGLILGQALSPELIKAQFVRAALTVPQVQAATCFLSSLKDRYMQGQVQFSASFVTPGATTPAVMLGGIVSFIGTNLEFVTFMGDNGHAVRFLGEII